MERDSEEESAFTLLAIGAVGLVVLKILLKADEPQIVGETGALRRFGPNAHLPPYGAPTCATCQTYAWGGTSRPQVARFDRGAWHHPACATLPENAWRGRGVPR